MRLALAFLAVLIGTVAFSSNMGTAVAAWPATCIHITPATRATAPMVDGQPDWKHVVVTGLVLDRKCFSYQVKK